MGGQAVIEGVMMRSPHSYAVAVRQPSGSLAVTQAYLDRPFGQAPVAEVPHFARAWECWDRRWCWECALCVTPPSRRLKNRTRGSRGRETQEARGIEWLGAGG